MDEIEYDNRQARIFGIISLLIGLFSLGWMVALPICDALGGADAILYTAVGIYIFVFFVSSGSVLLFFGGRGQKFLSRVVGKNGWTVALYVLFILVVGLGIQFGVDHWLLSLGYHVELFHGF